MDIAHGLIGTRQTKAQLSAEDCFFLAKERIDGQNPLTMGGLGGIDYAIAIEWAEVSLKLTENFKTWFEIEEFISETKKIHDENFIGPTKGLKWSYYPNERHFISKFENDTTKTGSQLRKEEYEVFKERYSSTMNFHHAYIRGYHQLCRGEKVVKF